MKTALLTTVLVAAGIIITLTFANAQVIPNYNFENWTNGDNSPPDGWADHGSNHTDFYPTTRTTDKIPFNGDSAQIIVYLTKTGYANPQGFGNLLAWGQQQFGAALTYTPFSFGYQNSMANFYYNDNTIIPDSAYIDIAAYKMLGTTPGSEPQPFGNSILYLDALNFDTYVNGINEHLDITKNFKLFPNSNCGVFDASFETAGTDYTAIKIYDIDGKEVENLFSGNLNSGNHTFHFDLENLDNGNYLLMVATSEGYRAEKICIQK